MLGLYSIFMDRFVSIPREALAALLKTAGSPLTPEQFVATLSQADDFRKYPGRASVSIVSKYMMLVAVILSAIWTCLPFGFSIEGVLVTLILAVITYFEFRVHAAFRDRDPVAPTLGYRNQLGFVALIVVYCFYHAFAPMQVPAGYREIMGDPDTTRLIRFVTIGTYLTIGVVGGISQFCLAWYYRSARIRPRSAE